MMSVPQFRPTQRQPPPPSFCSISCPPFGGYCGCYVPSPIQWVRRRELYARTYATIDRRSSHLGAVGPAPRRAAAEQLVSNTDDYNGERSDDRLQTDPISQRRLAHVDAPRMSGAAPQSVHRAACNGQRAASNAQRARSATAGAEMELVCAPPPAASRCTRGYGREGPQAVPYHALRMGTLSASTFLGVLRVPSPELRARPCRAVVSSSASSSQRIF
jgi:hypothetical protein